MSPFIPSATGTGGIAAAVTANLFDFSGNFRNRLPSATKRQRPDNWGSPPLGHPTPPKIDLPAVKALMVEAAKSALLTGKNTSAPNKLLAGSVMALYGLVEALLEKALLPFAEHFKTPPVSNQFVNPQTANTKPNETRELRAALERAKQNVDHLWCQPG